MSLRYWQVAVYVAFMGFMLAACPTVAIATRLALVPVKPPPVQAHVPTDRNVIQRAVANACKATTDARQCERDMMAIAFRESSYDLLAVGDQGKAIGAFQIHQGYHPGTEGCALDPYCAAHWTLRRLRAYGYPQDRARSIRCHNSCHNVRYYQAVNETSLTL